jgi:uncharacterized membrane protein YkvA (DUF1232 family)
MLKKLMVALVGVIAVIYLFNPTAGFIEFIPDNLPLIGNLDEAAATLLIINTLAFFGVDLHTLFQRDEKPKRGAREAAASGHDDAVDRLMAAPDEDPIHAYDMRRDAQAHNPRR